MLIYLSEFTYDDLEDTWNKIDRYFSLPERRQTFKYLFCKIYDYMRCFQLFVLVDLRYQKTETDLGSNDGVEGLRPRHSMSPNDDEMTTSYYMSCQKYVYGEQNSVPSPVRDHFRRQDESSSSISSSGHSHGRCGHSGKPSLEEVLKWLHALGQQVFMNREPVKVFVEEVDNESIWNNITFEKLAEFQTNFGEKVLDDEVMNKNNANDNVLVILKTGRSWTRGYTKRGEVLEEEVIIIETVNHFDDHVFYGNKVTPDRPRLRNPSKYRCTPYADLHTTPKQKRRPKKKVDAKSTTPFPPPAFDVAHDFSVLRLQPYVAGGEYRLYNLVLDREFWSALFGRTHNGWLDEAHLTIWIRLLMERRFDSDRYTIMSPNFFAFHVLKDGFDWRAFMSGIATYPNFIVPWWNVDTVLMSIHSFPNHW
uniref:Ubiquitin-like protease family profile domain-containing protein n=1 Tax=Lactuca sativa TaxID=4236 RepID=A0A9R1VFS7_LACSA|nr:hypothetical protein LSAT_V11C500287120 [Lactuca sativa]